MWIWLLIAWGAGLWLRYDYWRKLPPLTLMQKLKIFAGFPMSWDPQDRFGTGFQIVSYVGLVVWMALNRFVADPKLRSDLFTGALVAMAAVTASTVRLTSGD